MSPLPGLTPEALTHLGQEAWELFDVLDDVQFWVKDLHGAYVWVNRGFLINYSLDERSQVIGRTDFDLSPSHLADQYRLDDLRVLKGERIHRRLELVGRFDHTAVWSRTTKLPRHDAQGHICGSIGLTHAPLGAALEEGSPDFALARPLAYLRQHYAEPITNTTLAQLAGNSLRAFERRFTSTMHATPQQYLRRLRIRLACRILVTTNLPLGEIALDHGFCDQSHFTREFHRETGLTPGDYRARYSS